MPQWIDNILDKYITNLGYTKARGADVGTIWAGEAPLQPESRAWSEMDQDEWDRLAITSSWVYSDIDLIGGKASQPKLEVYHREGEEEAPEVNHPLEIILQRPNRFMSGLFLRHYTWLWWLLRGEAYWLKVVDQTGDLAELWPLPANRMRPIPDAEKYISGYGYQNKRGEPEQFLPADWIVFFRFPNPFDYHRGLAPLTAYSMALKTDIGAQKWNQGVFEDGVPFRVILSVPENMTTPNLTRFRQEIMDEFQARKRMLVARGGDIDARELGMGHKDLEFLAGREFTREEIDRVFGIPAGYWAKESTRANSEAAEAGLINHAVWPRIQMFDSQLNVQLTGPVYGEEYVVHTEDIRIKDRQLEIQEQQHKRGILTFDQARQAEGEDEYDGPLQEIIAPLPYSLATNPQIVLALMTKEEFGGSPPPPQLQAANQELPEQEGDEGEGGAEMPDAALEEMAQKALRDDLRRWESIARRRLRDGDDPAGYDFVSQFIPQALKAHITGLLAVAESDGDVSASFHHLKALSLDDVEQRVADKVQAIFEQYAPQVANAIAAGEMVDLDLFTRSLQGDLAVELAAIATENALKEAAETQIEIDPAIINEAATAWARAYAFELVSGITETTRNLLARVTEQYVNTPGMTIGDLENLLIPAFGEYRASMIAVTEVTRAYSQSMNMYQAMLKEQGLDFERIWQTNKDERVCVICGPLDSKPEGEWSGEFPDGPPAHPNCRCSATLRFRGRSQ